MNIQECKHRLLISGECHAKKIVSNKKLIATIGSDFDLVDISYGSGRIEDVLDVLDFYTFCDDDIFFLGGTVQDRWINETHYKAKLERLINTIFTRYKNSKIVFWNANVAPEHGTYDSIQRIIDIKEKLANQKNIFVKTIKFELSEFVGTSHFTSTGLNNFLNEIEEYLVSIKEELKKLRYEKVNVRSEMFLPPNENVVFTIDYKEKIPGDIVVEYHDGLTSTFNHHPGKNVIPDRKNILKLKNVKTINFSENIIPLECQVQYY